MGRFSTSEIRKPNYTEALGFEPTDSHRDEIAAVRHKVQQRIADENDGLIFIETHQALVMDRGSSTINFAVTSGAIYIVRNPLDVAISYAHHMGRSIDETIESIGTRDIETMVTDKAVYEVYGSWSQHVHSWTHKPHPAIHVMRYEDMVAAPAENFGRLVRHLLLDATPAQVGEAIDRRSFDKLRAREGTRRLSRTARGVAAILPRGAARPVAREFSRRRKSIASCATTASKWHGLVICQRFH